MRGRAEIASFLCRTKREVRDKARELDLRIYDSTAAHVEQRPDPPMTKPPTLNGHELTDEDLERLREQIESFDHIDEVGDEMRELIAERWPHLLSKVEPPKKQ